MITKGKPHSSPPTPRREASGRYGHGSSRLLSSGMARWLDQAPHDDPWSALRSQNELACESGDRNPVTEAKKDEKNRKYKDTSK